MGTPRDYYADLDLPPSADAAEIRKQYRKLALKYHPDRNPGREQEVNTQFQVIQSAHEVLSDPNQKAKYDASRARNKYPAASVSATSTTQQRRSTTDSIRRAEMARSFLLWSTTNGEAVYRIGS
ncbi:hypothetical protein FALBO_16540 [Fusarium albosuccineum]|uniref:J domain-containing protein n=1 Tax=Fusarium albosuccineum TaxID=1237068 RepID=A0A8H4KF29_9HYPO|nr:hypothetical protein FALBO_16540 [Fusarium albosuccineum]